MRDKVAVRYGYAKVYFMSKSFHSEDVTRYRPSLA